MEQENNNEGEQKTAEDLAKSQTSEKKGPNSSKAKSDIVKSMAKNFLKTRKAAGNSDVQSKKQKNKNKTVSEGSEETEENAKKLNSREENQQKDATAIAVHVMSEEIQKNQENKSDSQENGAKPNKRPKKRRREEEHGVLNKNWKSEGKAKTKQNEQKEKHSNTEKNNRIKEKHEGKAKTKQNEQKEKHSNTEKNNMIKEKHRGKGKQQETKKEKIDGLIFMCNAKTKPDCFRYRVMGVTQGKKDIVLGIKRGIKLFLYDYDLKLMYGIYKASSSGGMKLEPKAFGGDFPAQVRFSVHADCFPLAESIFKKAIKENYNKNNKFKTELTARQVRKLTELFRPVAVHPTALPMPSPPRAGARIHEHGENREVHDRARAPSDREASARDPYYASIGARSYSVLSQERDQQIAYAELASTRREDNRRDLYLNEKEYRAYGLQGERRNLTLQHSITPTLASYPRDYGEQLPRQLDSVYRESVPLQRDGIRSDPLYLSEREYRPYEMGATTSLAAASTLGLYATDPYRSRYYGGSLVESYLPRPRGEAPLIETNLWRRENNEMDKLQPAYASDALADYNQMHRNQDFRPEAASTSVSSRYSFGGASLSYR